MKKLWSKEDKRKNAKELISKLLPYVNDKGIEADSYTFLLQKELGASIDNYSTIDERCLIPSLVQMKVNNKASVEDYEQFHADVKISISKKNSKEKKRWSLFIPFDFISPTKKVSILGKNFFFIHKSDLLVDDVIVESIKAKIPSSKVLPSKKEEFIKDLPQYFLKTEVYALNPDSLWKEIEIYYDLLRGVIDYSTLFGEPPYAEMFRKDYNKRTKLSLPSLAIGMDDEKTLEVLPLISDSSQEFKTIQLSPPQESSFVFITKLFSKENNNKSSILHLMIDCFRLYGQSMDALHDHQAFLNLWQLAERISCTESFGGNSKEVAKRLNFFNKGKLPGSQCKFILEQCSSRRNTIVHRGIHKVDTDEITALKLNCEMALHWLMHNRNQIKTEEHLLAFYSLRDRDNTDLRREKLNIEVKKEVISIIEDERKGTNDN